KADSSIKENIHSSKKVQTTPPNQQQPDSKTIEAYVDGSFHKGSNRYSFGVAIIKDGEVLETLQRAGDNPKYQESWQIAGDEFVKVKAHSGVEFNGLADQLAKDALKPAAK